MDWIMMASRVGSLDDYLCESNRQVYEACVLLIDAATIDRFNNSDDGNDGAWQGDDCDDEGGGQPPGHDECLDPRVVRGMVSARHRFERLAELTGDGRKMRKIRLAGWSLPIWIQMEQMTVGECTENRTDTLVDDRKRKRNGEDEDEDEETQRKQKVAKSADGLFADMLAECQGAVDTECVTYHGMVVDSWDDEEDEELLLSCLFDRIQGHV